jgi:hypothetical protein
MRIRATVIIVLLSLAVFPAPAWPDPAKKTPPANASGLNLQADVHVDGSSSNNRWQSRTRAEFEALSPESSIST